MKGHKCPPKYCPKCSERTTVIDSRSRPGPPPYTYRRVKCKKCGLRFSTREYLEDNNIDKIMRGALIELEQSMDKVKSMLRRRASSISDEKNH